MQKKAKLIIVMTVFLDVVGIGIVIPGLPIYLENFTKSPFLIETFFAIYAICGFIAAPILGGLSDKYGRRPVLILSIIGTAIGWLIFSMGSKSMIFLVIGRIIDGITSGNISTAQTYLVDISKTPKERTANLGLIGAVFGVGFIIGPGIGGILSKISITLPFWTTAIMASLNALAAYMFLPETNQNKNANRKISINPFSDMKKVFANKSVRIVLVVWALYTLCFGIMQSIFSLYGHLAHDFSPSTNGLLLTLTGFVIALNQGFLLKKIWLKFFHEKTIEIFGVLALVISYALIALNSVYLLIFALIVSSFAQSLVRVVNNSNLSHLSPPENVGETMGVAQSIMFLSAIISPLIGGLALEHSLSLPWIISSILMLIAFVILKIEHLKWTKIKDNDQVIEPNL